MKIKIQGGWFDADLHEYTDDAGIWTPSATQILKLCGISNYDGIDPEVLRNAARRGSEVHELAAIYAKNGEVDPSWITEETQGYFSGYQRFIGDSGFIPDQNWIETGIIANIRGMQLGLTPDVFGKIGRDNWVIELKCAAAVQPSWSIQTGLQEMGIHLSNHVGRCRRGALQLFKTGRYKLHEHVDHQEDERIGIEALDMVYWRMRKGQNIRGMVIG